MKIVHKSWQDSNKQVWTKRATLKNSPTLTISGGLMWPILYVENASLIDWHHCGDKRFRYPVPGGAKPEFGKWGTQSKTSKRWLWSLRPWKKRLCLSVLLLHLPLVLFHKFFSWRRSSKSSMRWQMQMPHWLWRPWQTLGWKPAEWDCGYPWRWLIRRHQDEGDWRESFCREVARRWSVYAPVWLLPLKNASVVSVGFQPCHWAEQWQLWIWQIEASFWKHSHQKGGSPWGKT